MNSLNERTKTKNLMTVSHDVNSPHNRKVNEIEVSTEDFSIFLLVAYYSGNSLQGYVSSDLLKCVNNKSNENLIKLSMFS